MEAATKKLTDLPQPSICSFYLSGFDQGICITLKPFNKVIFQALKKTLQFFYISHTKLQIMGSIANKSFRF